MQILSKSASLFGNNGLSKSSGPLDKNTKVVIRSIAPFDPKSLRCWVETGMACSGNLRLQNAPYGIIQRIQIRRRWRPLWWLDEIRNFGLAPVLNDFCFVGRCRVLLKSLLALSENTLGPSFQAALKNRLPVVRSIDFYSRFDKNQENLSRSDMVPQIIIEVVFWNRWKALIYSRLSSKVPAYTLSFWAFRCSSMTNSFSSENTIRSTSKNRTAEATLSIFRIWPCVAASLDHELYVV